MKCILALDFTVRGAGAEIFALPFEYGRWIFGFGIDDGEELAFQLFRLHADQVTVGLVDGDNDAVFIRQAHSIHGIFPHGTEKHFGTLHRRPERGLFFGFLHGPADGGRQPIRLLLEQIIGRAGLQAFNRRLFADGAGNEDERNIRIFFPHHGQRIQAGERRQVIVRNNGVKRTGIQCGLKRRAVADAFHLDVHTVLCKKRTDQFGEIRVVFQM